MSDTLLRCERIEAEECAVVVEVVHSRSVGQKKTIPDPIRHRCVQSVRQTHRGQMSEYFSIFVILTEHMSGFLDNLPLLTSIQCEPNPVQFRH